ncbi:hypothetical protein GPALN_010191 [Globodera pallida]|nr:hypothetical protein GPALN_010191 [Globodera pallida]
MLEFCSRGKIGLVIYNAERERTKIDVTREFLLENDAFNINMTNKTIQPTQGRTENNDPVLRTIAWRIPSGASSSTTGHPEASAMATAHDEAITLSQVGETESEVEETESEDDETDSETALDEAITLVLSRTIAWRIIPPGASSSTTGHPEASTMATAHDEAITLSQIGETESEDDETDSETALDEAITLVLSRTIAWRILSGASSSTTGHPETSTMATAHNEAITLYQAGETESEDDETDSEDDETDSETALEEAIALFQVGETESEVEETESEDDETDSETALDEAITLSQVGETESEVEETESEDDETDSETALDEAITLSQVGETKSEVDEMEPKQHVKLPSCLVDIFAHVMNVQKK